MPPGCEDSPRPNVAERLPPDSDQEGEPSDPGIRGRGPGVGRRGRARHRQDPAPAGPGTAGRAGHRQGRAPAAPGTARSGHRQSQ
jgi:hypothetical protein